MSTEFVNQMWPHALRVSQQTGLDPRLVIAQSALETGWGRSAPGNNYFGIKSHGKPGGNNLGTWEVVNGQRVNINDSFRAYDGMGASADGYAQFLMENPRYRGMLAADGLDAQIDALASSGYATDPQYGTKVRSIATGITPPSQDIADETMAVLGLSPMSNQPSAPAGRTDSTISTRGPEPMQEYQPEKAGGILGMLFPKMTADRQDSIALALSGLGRGNPALEANLRDRMGGRRDDRKEFEQQQQQRAQMNRTLQVLGQAGFDEQDLALAAENPEYMRAMVGQLAQRRLAEPERPDPRTQIAKLQADLNDGLISQQQYEMALQALAQKDGMSLSVGPDGQVSFSTGGAQVKPLTEGQSKDTTYATRARGALPMLDKYDVELSQIGERALDYDPTGLLRSRMQSPEYQMAKQAGDEFLQAILRKDTGAAITADEQTLYGTTYLPQPGDGPDVIEQKRQARARALAALEAGMPPAAIIQQEKALSQSGSANSRGGAVDFSKMSAEDLSRVDVMSLSPEQLQALQKRFDELGL